MLGFDGIATVASVTLDGELLFESTSMFERHEVSIAHGGVLEVHCHALAPLLDAPRKPRARWRSRLANNNLRWYRTMLLGRAPGFAPEPAAVGPYRAAWLERRHGLVVDELRVRTDGEGTIHARVAVRAIGGDPPAGVELVVGDARALVELTGGRGEATLVVPDATRWWPHTHGDPVLHELLVVASDGQELATRRVGFRTLAWEQDIDVAGVDLRVNGVPVFARGAVWTPADPIGLAPSEEDLRATLVRARDAGMNMIRIPGTACYESDTFHDLCDELGLLVWQDFMFANFDYPVADAAFRETVAREARDVVGRLAHRPSLAVLCGSSEVEQQVAMLGLDPALGRGELFGELLPSIVDEAEVNVPYVPSAPCGGELPFRTDVGVANYYGVGGYRRPLSDARLAGVRFAAECLALANVPDDDADADEGVPRDAGADWDFADVRDHYLELLFGVDPSSLERDRYLDLSRATSGEVMAEVFGEFRRCASPCRGALVLWLRDPVPGAGWGLLDRDGRPKAAFRQLARALAPVAVWTTDEGLNGVDVHVANDRGAALAATLRVSLYRDLELRVDEVSEELVVAPHTTIRRGIEAMLGRFVDASWVYRFGPPGQDAIVVSLERGDELLSQAFRFPAGRPLVQEDLGLEAVLVEDALVLTTRRLAYGVRVHGAETDDDFFSVEPGRARRVRVDGRPTHVTAINLDGRVEP